MAREAADEKVVFGYAPFDFSDVGTYMRGARTEMTRIAQKSELLGLIRLPLVAQMILKRSEAVSSPRRNPPTPAKSSTTLMSSTGSHLVRH